MKSQIIQLIEKILPVFFVVVVFIRIVNFLLVPCKQWNSAVSNFFIDKVCPIDTVLSHEVLEEESLYLWMTVQFKLKK